MKILNYILVALLLGALGYIGYLYLNPELKEVYIKAKPLPAEIIKVADSGRTTIIKEVDPVDHEGLALTAEKLQYLETELLPALNEGAKYKAKVDELTAVNAQLQGEVSKKDVVKNEAEKEVLKWKSKYIAIEANIKDSTAKYAYNAELNIAKYRQKHSLFGEKESFVAISTPDKNLKVNSVERYVQKISPDKDLMDLTIEGKAFINPNSTKKINDIGIGTYINAEFNPDGRFRPSVYGGYRLGSGEPVPEVGVKMRVKVFGF
ncbi:hypothetical protein J2810_004643 [Chryseobacterium rhizosphaerae]|uniref:hypothetical protein n=1 Tax=Chryseobacterium rhizosphaerae TaxID=395937 RepID=UPI00285F80AF|nr:hypothetical protein [Chryseobacterium rhizosphaerae]MDR6548553.1 hypothetical protein [Chryseobacterium rhizosphaerae]